MQDNYKTEEPQTQSKQNQREKLQKDNTYYLAITNPYMQYKDINVKPHIPGHYSKGNGDRLIEVGHIQDIADVTLQSEMNIEKVSPLDGAGNKGRKCIKNIELHDKTNKQEKPEEDRKK